MNRMRRVQVFAAVIALGALLLSTRSGQATQVPHSAGTFERMITALNANDAVGVQAHLAEDFSLTFIGGTALTGAEAAHLLLLLDTPITIVTLTPGGDQKGTAVLEFGNQPPHYTVHYTGARNGRFASWTIDIPTTPDE